MTDPASVMAKLDELSAELDERSKELAATERDLEPVEERYEQTLGDWESALWEESQMTETKWPPEKLRLRMAHRAMDPQLLGSFNSLTAKRRRLEKRIGTVKSMVDAQRSILSALKEEMAATR